MIVKTSELEGVVLDWAVSQVEGVKGLSPYWNVTDEGGTEAWLEKDGLGLLGTYSPSRSWQCGGPLIEKHQVELLWIGSDGKAIGWNAYHQDVVGFQCAETPLIAAMRAIVASELGETVDVPEELIK